MLMLGILSFESFAQSRVGTFSIIPKIGTNIASVTNNKLYTDVNDKLDSKSNTGFTFGVDLQYQATDRVALSAGIGYSRQGYRYDDTKWKSESESTTEYDVYETWTDFHQNIDYLTIPVMVKYYMFPNFTIGAGVQAGFILDNKCSYEVSSYKEYPNGCNDYIHIFIRCRNYSMRSDARTFSWTSSLKARESKAFRTYSRWLHGRMYPLLLGFIRHRLAYNPL